MLTVCAYALSAIGVFSGIYAFRKGHWKVGCAVMVVGLAVAAGDRLNIGGISASADGSFNRTQVFALSNQVAELSLDFDQTIIITQQLHQTFNQITKVEKEVVDLTARLNTLYRAQKRAWFMEADRGQRFQAFGGEFGTVVYFELDQIPIENSVDVSSHRGTRSPFVWNCFRNVVAYRCNTPPDEFIDDPQEFFYLRYWRDPDATNELLTVRGMTYKGTKGDPLNADFPHRDQSDSPAAETPESQ